MTIAYTVRAARPDAHLFHVSMRIESPSSDGQRIAFANWIPGSYMIRDFARSIVAIRARDARGEVTLEKLDKATWQAPGDLDGDLQIELDVHAREASVRAAWLDRDRAFFNGTSLFPYLPDRLDEDVTLELSAPTHAEGASWRVATTLEAVDVDERGFGRYRAGDHDELVDHPVEAGDHDRVEFEACGVPHAMVLAGGARFDRERLRDDLARICTEQIRFFGEPAPVARYLFQVALADTGYGGLEHRASTALMATRDALPLPGATERSESYETFLGLCSHEYFHTWNVKRIKPARFVPYDVARETHTRLLWFFEGITSYYDDVLLVRAGLLSRERYLELLSKTISRVQRGGGRQVQSVTDSSFDAWTKFYKQDENAPNAIVSYYAKGALMSLCLDAWMRDASEGALSLDDLMRDLWQRWLATGEGLAEDEPERRVAALLDGDAGRRVAERLADLLDATGDLPLEAALETLGVELSWRCRGGSGDDGSRSHATKAGRPWFGAMLADDPAGARLVQVFNDGPAERAGLAPGDVVIAIGGYRVNASTLDDRLHRHAELEQVSLHAFRGGRLDAYELAVASSPADVAVLAIADADRTDDWLGCAASA